MALPSKVTLELEVKPGYKLSVEVKKGNATLETIELSCQMVSARAFMPLAYRALETALGALEYT